MASTFKDITINGVATQTEAPSSANHLVTLTYLQSLLTALGLGHSGVRTLTASVATGSVTALGLNFTPTKCLLSLSIPTDGFFIEPKLIEGTLDADGFDYYLSALPPGAGYKLHYLLLP
jgi:hypothetical protein